MACMGAEGVKGGGEAAIRHWLTNGQVQVVTSIHTQLQQEQRDTAVVPRARYEDGKATGWMSL